MDFGEPYTVQAVECKVESMDTADRRKLLRLLGRLVDSTVGPLQNDEREYMTKYCYEVFINRDTESERTDETIDLHHVSSLLSSEGKL